jgi:IclR family acetate operon transcriptional repressor
VARTGLPATRHVEAVQRAIAILDELAEARGELGTNEIARRTGINVSTISRILATLASGGLVDHIASTGRYRLGAGVVRLANAAGLDLRSLARPHLEELGRSIGETVTLSVPGEYEAFTIDFVQSQLTVRSVAEVGRISVAHATAAGKVFLAYGGKLADGPLRSFTDRTVTDRNVLDAELASIRDRGWAQAVREREDDMNAIAAPVFDRAGKLVAVLGVQGPAVRFGPRAMRAAVPLLTEKAALISSAL